MQLRSRNHLSRNFRCFLQFFIQKRQTRTARTEIAAYFSATCISCIFLHTQKTRIASKAGSREELWCWRCFGSGIFGSSLASNEDDDDDNDGTKIFCNCNFEREQNARIFSASINCRFALSSIWCRGGMRPAKTQLYILLVAVFMSVAILITRYDCLSN